MTTWHFSDGTAAHLGGIVEGGSLFAQELRAELATGNVLIVPIRIPGPGRIVDPTDPALFDAWLRNAVSMPYRKGIRITASPENIPPLPPTPDDDFEPEEGVLY